jgi:multiple sugar transport system ATP-binding protein
MATIRIEGLAKRYDGQQVLGPLDLRIEDGEFFTFVGPSGCGKSTLLNLIAGIDAPSAGRIWFDDRDVSLLSPGERDIAMVFQSYALYPHLTVRENIGFPLRVRGRPRSEIAHEVDRVARTLGLVDLLERRPRQLSGGQRQRVALGRALVRRPAAFLMDEPLSNLDAGLRLEMRAEFKRLHELHGVTTVYVTHDQEEAMVLSDRLAVLDAGSIRQCGSPQRLYDDPDDLFVARFLGSPPINVVRSDALAGLVSLVAPRATSAGPELFAVRPAQVTVGVEPGRDALAGTVVLTESTGADLWVIAELAGQRIRGRAAPGARPQRGSTVYLRIDAGAIQRFDEASGARVRIFET